jgi:hypothetical protein
VKKSGRTSTEIYYNVPHFTLNASHQFGFGMRWHLIVQASHCSFLESVGVVDLGNGLAPSGNGKLVSTKQARQKASVIT